MKIQTVGVIGCGLMGGGIAQTSVQAGYVTIVREVSQELLDKGIARIKKAWQTMVSKEKITQAQSDEYAARLRTTTQVEELAECDLVIEAIVENIEEKLHLFTALDHLLKPEALIVSNTSSLNITQMGAITRRPAQVAGLHFFNPAPVMKLVEIVKTLNTSEETIRTLREFAISLGKTPVLARDSAGFIVNFLLIPYLNAAIRMLENGMATKEDIDTAMKLGCGYPMGPFALLDYVGLDTALWASEAIYEEYKEPLYAPPPLLRRMVLAGKLGKKNGEGFYSYNN